LIYNNNSLKKRKRKKKLVDFYIVFFGIFVGKDIDFKEDGK
jgi:hypothetical protein